MHTVSPPPRRRRKRTDNPDALYTNALTFVQQHAAITARALAAELGITDFRAGNILKKMEAEGIVGPANGPKPRPVLRQGEVVQSKPSKTGLSLPRLEREVVATLDSNGTRRLADDKKSLVLLALQRLRDDLNETISDIESM